MVENADWTEKNYPKVLYEHYGPKYHSDSGVWLCDANGELILLTQNTGIHRYDSKSDDWNKIMDYPDKNNYYMCYNAATQRLNDKNAIISLCECTSASSMTNINGIQFRFIQFDLDTKTFKYLSPAVDGIGSSVKVFCDIDDENIHFLTRETKVFAPRFNDFEQNHYIFNLDANNCRSNQSQSQSESGELQLQKFQSNLPMIYNNPVFVECRNSFFTTVTMGNYPSKIHIMEYLCQDKKWNMWECMKGINYNSRMITPHDENNRYLIIFSGQNLNKQGRKDGIDFTLYDFKKNILYQSKLKFPRKHPGASNILIARDINKIENEYLVFGFLRKQDSNFNKDLMSIVNDYVCFDSIHWIERGNMHATVSVDKLFDFHDVVQQIQ